MDQGDDRRGGKAQIRETEPDVDQHADDRNDDRNDCISSHLIRNRSGYGLKADGLCLLAGVVLVGIDRELLVESVGKLLAFVIAQRAGLEDDFIAAGNLLCLHLRLPDHLLNDRLDLCIDGIDVIGILERHICGGSAAELHREVQSPSSCSMICDAGDRAGQDCDQSDREEKLPAPDHVEPLDRDHLSEILRIGHAKRIEGLNNPLGHEERRKHGQENTKCQGFGEALHRACSHDVKNQACDQCGDIAVDDSRQGLAESGVNGRTDRVAVCNLLADAGIDDDVCIDCHTD